MKKQPTTAERNAHAQRLVKSAQYWIEHETGRRSKRLDRISADIANGDTERAVKKLTAGKKPYEWIKTPSDKGFADTHEASRHYAQVLAYLVDAYHTLTETDNN